MVDISSHRRLSFLEAVRYAANEVPGLAHDMKFIAELRKGQPKDMQGIGRFGVKIPDPIMELMRGYFPALFQEDSELRQLAWIKWMKSSDAQPFRVGRKL